ncbi:MAG: bifunctional NADH-specific enoyl-ACP reductase/trans-2-enoyl-CoA reductase [Deltaproteobacteria bacterium]|nr:MAG: bifunctional NADH-specific enoyl-ACP reductase/trans-2-enoyl-CoA reductase [Deltaproteobacteria bacterium]
MKIEPKIRQNICLTAHPEGCREQVREQIAYVRNQPTIEGPKRVLVVGASNGYGLAARIVSAFSCGAATAGVFLERSGTSTRTATVGWYNNLALEQEARSAGLVAFSVNGDSFSPEVKNETIQRIGDEIGPVDCLIYSIAAPRRIDPETGQIYSSVVKPIGRRFNGKTVDIKTGALSDVVAEPATEDEIAETVKVMGGEDWMDWISALHEQKMLDRGAVTVALSYVGSDITASLYRDGTIGRAKQHLEATAAKIQRRFADQDVRAVISVNKALVTRASAVIPTVTLYISLLYTVMKRKGLHEGCIQQMYRLYRDYLYAADPKPLDPAGRIRLDDWEMREDVQREVKERWEQIRNSPSQEVTEIAEFRSEFLRHHGFEMPGVDYDQDVEAF